MVSIISKYKYSEIISNLIEWKIIESDSSYQVGNYSTGFKFLPPYDSGVRKIRVKDERINNKINRFKMSSFKDLKKLPQPYQYLSMTNTRIEIDKRRASYYNTMTYQLTEKDVYDSNFYSINAFADRDYRFSVDTTGNRAHTNLTNLKKDLRSFLSVDGENLGQVDIKNSQPLFFYLHIKDNPEIQSDEKERYREVVENGIFYEFFMERLGIPQSKRSKVKQRILTAIFSDKDRSKESRYMTILKQEFPTIAGYILENRVKDYKALICTLQRIESNFIIEKAVAEFIRQYGDKNEFVSTIHDSIVVKASMLEEAESTMRFCFGIEGLYPKFEAKRFEKVFSNGS